MPQSCPYLGQLDVKYFIVLNLLLFIILVSKAKECKHTLVWPTQYRDIQVFLPTLALCICAQSKVSTSDRSTNLEDTKDTDS
jgi:hypothetical protein